MKNNLDELSDDELYASYDAYKALLDTGLTKAQALSRTGLTAQIVKDLELEIKSKEEDEDADDDDDDLGYDDEATEEWDKSEEEGFDEDDTKWEEEDVEDDFDDEEDIADDGGWGDDF